MAALQQNESFLIVSAGSDFDERSLADSAFGVLDRAAPEIGAEIRSLLTEIVFVAGAPNDTFRFDGAASFFCWGALFLNADEHLGFVKMIDGLAHESAHAYLFSLSLGDRDHRGLEFAASGL